jgi:adenine-specific DNA-methyltransferase
MAILNYIGSKKSLLEFIDYVMKDINEEYENMKKIKMLDGFAGSGIVGKYFNKKYGYKIYSNDMEYYSYIISYALLKVEYNEKIEKIIIELNKLTKPKDDKKYNLITENYSEKGKEGRKFWSITNSVKVDAIMENIHELKENKEINHDEYIFLLASVVSSIDKYANTASVYGAYLKKYKQSSLKEVEIKAIHKDKKIINMKNNIIINMDINNRRITDEEYDIVYLDPPYNNRQYSSNYHPLNYVCRYDENIKPYGKTGLIENSNKSKYSITKKVEETFRELIENIKSKYILLSYNNEGIMTSNTIKEILTKKGKTTLYKYKYKKFKSNINQENETVYEYLYLCEVNKIGDYSSYIVDL